jgi:hypothetical protein
LFRRQIRVLPESLRYLFPNHPEAEAARLGSGPGRFGGGPSRIFLDGVLVMSGSVSPRKWRAFRAACSVALCCSGVSADAAEEPSRIGADDPAASAASPAYRSPFEGFRRFAVEPPADWRSVNDAVGAAGGHGGAMKDGGSERRSVGPATQAPDSPAGAGHAGHD